MNKDSMTAEAFEQQLDAIVYIIMDKPSPSHKEHAKQSPSLKGIKFTFGDYREMRIPRKSLIYCDPPYANSAKYDVVGDFNTDEFWRWCDARSDEGNIVFVSEYQAPEHWQCVWEKSVNSSLSKDTGAKKAVEKLFTRSSHE